MERLLGTPGSTDGVDKDLLLRVLDGTVAALAERGVTFLVMGGIASAILMDKANWPYWATIPAEAPNSGS